MKQLFTFVVAAIITFSAAAQIPNAGFESWTTTGGYSTPDGWGNLNAMTAADTLYTCNEGTPGYAGAAYLKLVSKSVMGMGVMPGVAVSGNLNPTTFLPTSGFAYTSRPANLTGAWQYMAWGSDMGFVAAMLWKWNSGTNSRDTIAYVYRPLSGMVMSWSTFSIPLTYVSTSSPDSAVIILSASGSTPVANSYLYVDTLAFSGAVTGVASVHTNITSAELYPNPATGDACLRFNAAEAATVHISISDISGKMMSQRSCPVSAGSNTVSLDTHALPKGLYIVGLVSDGYTEAKKLIIQ